VSGEVMTPSGGNDRSGTGAHGGDGHSGGQRRESVRHGVGGWVGQKKKKKKKRKKKGKNLVYRKQLLFSSASQWDCKVFFDSWKWKKRKNKKKKNKILLPTSISTSLQSPTSTSRIQCLAFFLVLHLLHPLHFTFFHFSSFTSLHFLSRPPSLHSTLHFFHLHSALCFLLSSLTPPSLSYHSHFLPPPFFIPHVIAPSLQFMCSRQPLSQSCLCLFNVFVIPFFDSE